MADHLLNEDFEISGHWSAGVRQPERLISALLVLGTHLPKDFLCPEMAFRIPGLQIWQSRRSIEYSLEVDEATGTSTVRYEVTRFPKESIRVPALSATLDMRLGGEWSTDDFSSVSATVVGWMAIRPDSPQSLTWYFEQLSKLTTMLSLLAGTPMGPDSISASIDEAPTTASVLATLPNSKLCNYKNFHNFFVPRGAMGIELSEVVVRWFAECLKVDMPSRLAMSILASEKLWLHVEFLSLVQALEGFHRGLYPSVYMSAAEYVPVRNAMSAAIPPTVAEDHKEALRSRLRYGNEISLRKRLDALAQSLSERTRKLIFGSDPKVLQRWIDTRNYYTHWDESLRARVFEDQEMYAATIRMRAFLHVLYLAFMGVPATAIEKALLGMSDLSQNLVRVNAIERRRINADDRYGTIGTITEVDTKQNDA